jgi:restriction endonuclease S subunit
MYQNKIDIGVEFGRLNTVMDWCREHCSGNWTISDSSATCNHNNMYSNFVNNYHFEFSDVRDLVTFNLKFK